MDRQAFVQNLDRVKRRKILLLRIGLSFLFIALVTWMGLSKSHLAPATLHYIKMGLIAFFAALAYTLFTMVQNLSRRLGVCCPHCQRILSGPLSAKVLESGACFQCGASLFD